MQIVGGKIHNPNAHPTAFDAKVLISLQTREGVAVTTEGYARFAQTYEECVRVQSCSLAVLQSCCVGARVRAHSMVIASDYVACARGWVASVLPRQ